MMNASNSLFSLYQQTIEVLGYPQQFQESDHLWESTSIDELSGLIATTDSEIDMLGFFAECDQIEQAIKSFGVSL